MCNNCVKIIFCQQIYFATFHFLSNRLYFCCIWYLFQFFLSAKIFSRWCFSLPNGNQYKYLKIQMDDRINENCFLQQKKKKKSLIENKIRNSVGSKRNESVCVRKHIRMVRNFVEFQNKKWNSYWNLTVQSKYCSVFCYIIVTCITKFNLQVLIFTKRYEIVH